MPTQAVVEVPSVELVDDVVDDLCTYLDTSGAQRPARLPEWEDVQELAEEYEVTL